MIFHRRIKRISLLALLLFAVLIFSMPVLAAKKKPKGKKASGPRIAVVDITRGTYVKDQVRALKKAGARPVIITSKKFSVSSFDGLVIPAGEDVSPRFYHEKPAGARRCNPKRDRLQIYAIKKFIQAQKPIFGVCRGCQIINVALGGSLHQHITGHISKMENVTISPGSWLSPLYGPKLKAMHYHHEACKKMGDGLVIVARSSHKSGNRVEAFQHASLPIYAVQFHPEKMGERGAKIYKAFVKECKTRQKR